VIYQSTEGKILCDGCCAWVYTLWPTVLGQLSGHITHDQVIWTVFLCAVCADGIDALHANADGTLSVVVRGCQLNVDDYLVHHRSINIRSKLVQEGIPSPTQPLHVSATPQNPWR
jgi:hypothetical protein